MLRPFPRIFMAMGRKSAGKSLRTPAQSEGNDIGKNRRNVNNEVTTPLHLMRAALCATRQKLSSHSMHCIPLRIRSRSRLASPGWYTRESVTIVWGDYLFSSLYKICSSHFAPPGGTPVFRDVCTCCSCLLSAFGCSTLEVVRVFLCVCVRVRVRFFHVSRPVVSTCFVLIRFASSCVVRE